MADRGGTSRLLLVEGVPGLGKSTTVDGVVRRYVAATPAEQLRTVVALAQTRTKCVIVVDTALDTLSSPRRSRLGRRRADRSAPGLAWRPACC